MSGTNRPVKSHRIHYGARRVVAVHRCLYLSWPIVVPPLEAGPLRIDLLDGPRLSGKNSPWLAVAAENPR